MKLRTKWLPSYFFVLAAPAVMSAGDRITHSIDVTRTVKLEQALRPEAIPANDRGSVDAGLVLDGVTIVLKPSADQQAALEALLEAQRDPSSADYRNWLTPEEFGDRFGLSVNDVGKIASWLRSRGLNVDEVARGRNWIQVSGTAELFKNALQIDIHNFSVNGKMHYAPTKVPSIPEALVSEIAAIRGLDDFKLAPAKLRLTPLSPDYTASASTHYLAPNDFATIYDITPMMPGVDGTGQSIAVVGQTDINLADIQAFRTQFGLPANVPKIVLAGTDPGTSQNDLVEAELDLEWAGSVARNATIVYVNSKNVWTSAQYAVNNVVAPVISMSYGGCEQQNSSSERQLAQQANAQGMTWIASSGDSGAAGCDAGTAKIATLGLGVNMPASIPEVTGIGGTTFSEGAGSYWAAANATNGSSALSYIPEASWNDTVERNELSASGGGVSTYFTKPTWQTGAGVPADGMRDVPDLAFAASPDHDGYLVYTKGALGVVGGTSAPTPAFAGVVALLNQYLLTKGSLAKAGLGNINPSLYHLSQNGVFHDVTSGNNIVPCKVGTANCTIGSLGYIATAGYDLVTGLGSVDIFKLFTNWTNVVSSVSTTTTLSASPASIASTASTNLTATVKPASGTAVPAGTVTFSFGATTLGTASLSASAVATFAVAGSRLTVGTDTVTATYSGSSSFAASAGSAVVTVTGATQSGVSQVVPTVNPNPVPEVNGSWPLTITLTEEAGQATTLTNFTMNGASYASQIRNFFGTANIAAKGAIAASLRISGVAAPSNVVFGFAGTDPSGRQWAQSLTVAFTGPAATSTH